MRKLAGALFLVLVIMSMALSMTPFLAQEAHANVACSSLGAPGSCPYVVDGGWCWCKLAPSCCCRVGDQIATCW
jgi:hypothetical protein